MSTPEHHAGFAREANRDCEPAVPTCYLCGEACSGNTLEMVYLDDVAVDVPVCDPDR